MTLKNAVKELLPESLTRRIGRMLMLRRQRRLSRLAPQDAFDEIYRKRMWKQGGSLSGVGSEGTFAERYIQLVLDYAKQHNIRTVVDAGCGDFSVGSRLALGFDRYMAFDISPYIIEINKRRFADLVATGRVTFGVADMTATTFPKSELILIRQVLQHLTNAQIEQILVNLEASQWHRVLIAEEVHDPENNQRPNVDIPSHNVGNRVAVGSGVFIDREPFNRLAKRIAIIRTHDNAPGSAQSGLLVFEIIRSNGHVDRTV